MPYQATHPCEIGLYGRFGYGGSRIVEKWSTLEELFEEDEANRGRIWHGPDVIAWALNKGLIDQKEFDEWSKNLGGLPIQKQVATVE